MGFAYRVYLDNEQKHKIYACSKCKTHLSTRTRRISKDFRGMYGKASLFDEVVNVKVSTETEERMMTTGKHSISFISCIYCGDGLGWKYIKAYEEDQKYKEGRFILEQCNLYVIRDIPDTYLS